MILMWQCWLRMSQTTLITATCRHLGPNAMLNWHSSKHCRGAGYKQFVEKDLQEYHRVFLIVCTNPGTPLYAVSKSPLATIYGTAVAVFRQLSFPRFLRKFHDLLFHSCRPRFYFFYIIQIEIFSNRGQRHQISNKS